MCTDFQGRQPTVTKYSDSVRLCTNDLGGNKMKISERTSGVSLHFEKHKANDVSVNGLQRHNERIPGQSHRNANIDDKRTKDNVFLKKSDGKFNKQVEKTIEQKRKNGLKGVRKDAVRMVEATVQLSGKILDDSEEEQEKVLRNSYDWLKNQFGEDNVISAVIHKDETNIHLHFDFVPFTDGNKLSAKEIVTKSKLHEYQNNFLKYLQSVEPNGNFERGAGELQGLSQRDFEKVQKMIQDKEKEINEREDKLDKREDTLDGREEKLKEFESNMTSRLFKLKQQKALFNKREKEQQENIFYRLNKLDEREANMNTKVSKVDKKALETQNERIKVIEKQKALERRETLLNEREANVNTKASEVSKKALQAQSELRKAVEERNMVERLKNRLGNTWNNIVKAVQNGTLHSREVEKVMPKPPMTQAELMRLNDDLMELSKNKGLSL